MKNSLLYQMQLERRRKFDAKYDIDNLIKEIANVTQAQTNLIKKLEESKTQKLWLKKTDKCFKTFITEDSKIPRFQPKQHKTFFVHHKCLEKKSKIPKKNKRHLNYSTQSILKQARQELEDCSFVSNNFFK